MNAAFTHKKVRIFLALTFSITYALGLITYLNGGLEKFPAGMICSMLVPMLAAFYVQKFVSRENLFKHSSLGFNLKNWKLTLGFMLTIFVLFGLFYLVTYLIRPELFLGQEKIIARLNSLNIPFNKMPFQVRIIMVMCLNIIFAPFLNIVLFLGEEVGWRGFLYGKLVDLYGRKGLIIGGIIWGIWHCPMVLMGLNYPRNPIIGLFLMLIFTVSVGIIFYYFYRRTGSVFAPALAHGVINWTGKTIMMLFINEDKINMLIDGPTGIPALFLLSFIAFILYLRIDWSAKKLTK